MLISSIDEHFSKNAKTESVGEQINEKNSMDSAILSTLHRIETRDFLLEFIINLVTEQE